MVNNMENTENINIQEINEKKEEKNENLDYSINKIDINEIIKQTEKRKKKKKQKIEKIEENQQQNETNDQNIQLPNISQLLTVPLIVLNQYLSKLNISPLSDEEKIILIDATDKLFQYYNVQVTPPVYFFIVITQIAIPRIIQYLNLKKKENEQNNSNTW